MRMIALLLDLRINGFLAEYFISNLFIYFFFSTKIIKVFFFDLDCSLHCIRMSTNSKRIIRMFSYFWCITYSSVCLTCNGSDKWCVKMQQQHCRIVEFMQFNRSERGNTWKIWIISFRTLMHACNGTNYRQQNLKYIWIWLQFKLN